MKIFEWLQALADLLFPPACLSCNALLPKSAPPLLCADCAAQVRAITSPFCLRCGTALTGGKNRVCSECLAHPPEFALARSFFYYEGPVRDGILAFKFHSDMAWLPSLAFLCRNAAQRFDFTEPDFLVPVPLHASRLRERGFNQSLLLAKSCFPEWRHKIEARALYRTRPTPPQTSLGGAARKKNLHGAFAVREYYDFHKKNVLLFDDVLTTGSTVRACSCALLAAGARRVEVFTLARSALGENQAARRDSDKS